MKDSEYQAVRDHCKAVALDWITLCGVSWDKVHLCWVDRLFSEEQDGHPPSCIAFVNCNWEYLEAAITFSCAKLWEYFTPEGQPEDADEVREIVVHELCHILVNEMREYAKGDGAGRKHEERVVTRIARAMCYAYDQGVKRGMEQRDAAR